ncbi:UDP-3-O-glucosamine N-acyltransferase [Crepidotus variabilis]|uniref:Translation initiation factor eIF2B subunit gamma n=1 Tax=Crepidotus variabilis TaxID=179855 RepID=A0A9P6JQ81_9AGAR|nr:UDP-3-O-glucosamine N-acyltransferase [Crepidotus variabilis]
MDLENVKPDLATKEFLAVVLAGFGDALVPLTSDYGDEPCPKALLPVANKPLIEYVLAWIERSGIHDILIICPTLHRSSIYHHIHSDMFSSSLRIDLQTYEESEEDNAGTCTVLRHFSSRITEDFIVVPCDFLPPSDLPLSLLLDKFRVDALSEGCLATTCWYQPNPPEKISFIEEWGPPPPTFPIVWDPSSGTLLHVDTPDDQDRNPEDIDLQLSMLSKFPHTRLCYNMEDSHVYVCRRRVLDLLHEKPHLSSLREEFLPWLCKDQYRRPKRRKTLSESSSSRRSHFQFLSLRHSSLNNSSLDLDFSMEHASSPAKIGIFVPRGEAPVRINTPQKFYEMSRRILSSTVYSLPTNAKDRSLIDAKAQISSDSIIGHSSQISERATIKKSVVGRHCVIGKMVKIVGCILFDHCVIEDGAKLDGCILGKSTLVGAKAELIRCITQAGYEVGAGESAKGEKMEVSDWMATPGEGEDLAAS